MLNQEQQLAAIAIENWLASGGYMSLIGSAGTGKTYTLAQSLKEKDLSKVCFVSPTHKAKKVAEKFFIESGITLDCYTLAGALGKQPEISDDGKQEFKIQNLFDIPATQYKRVLIDESSMIGKEDLKELISYCQNICFVGDDYQLPPVGEDAPQAFEYVRKNIGKQNFLGEFRLQHPERYNGAIKEFVYAALDRIKTNSPEKINAIQTILDIQDEHEGDSGLQLARSWVDVFNQNRDTIFTTFTNKSVNEINSRCRKIIYGDDVPEWLVGEEIMAYQPIRPDQEKPQILANSDTAIITKIEPSEFILGSNKINCYNISIDKVVLDINGHKVHPDPFPVVAQDNWAKYSNLLDEYAAAAKRKERRWSEFYWAKSLHTDVRHTYAMTVHKSQGSSFANTCFVDKTPVKDTCFYHKLLYVASSRAKGRFTWTKS